MIVDLNAFDLLHIALFAERQRCVKRSLGVTSRKHDKAKGEFELHYIGAMGEYAVSRVCSVPLDFAVHAAGDNGTDLTINGHTCQIKTFAHQAKNIDFFIDNMEAFSAQVCIGVQLLSPTRVKIMGCIGKRKFHKLAVKKNYGYGERLKVPATELSPIEVLYD